MKASIQRFHVSIENTQQVLFTIIFDDSSTLTIGDKYTCSMKDWQYAFIVDIGSHKYQAEKIMKGEETLVTPEATEEIKKTILNSKIPPNRFTINSLFLDFQNSNILNYRQIEETKQKDDDREKDDDINRKYYTKIKIHESFRYPNGKEIRGMTKEKITQCLQLSIDDYVRNQRKEENPYILGYSLSFLPELSEIEESPFDPTYCTFSTSCFNKGKSQTINFLMMTEKPDPPKHKSAGILNNNLVSDTNSDGALAIKFPLFESKVLKQIVDIVEESLGEIIDRAEQSSHKYEDKEKNESKWYFLFNKINSCKIETKKGTFSSSNKKEYHYTIKEEDSWQIKIRGNYSSGSYGIKRQEGSYIEKIRLLPTISLVNPKNELKLHLKIKIEVDQSLTMIENNSILTIFTGANGNRNEGCLEEEISVDIFIKPVPEDIGKLSIKISDPSKNNLKKQTINPNLGERFNSIIEEINTDLQNISNEIKKQLDEKISNNFKNKVILPLGNVYTFENIRLYESFDRYNTQDNAVVCDINYNPKYLPL